MNIKKQLQAPLRRRQTKKYEAEIDRQRENYHDWILKKEARETGSRSLAGQTLQAELVEYTSCGPVSPLGEAKGDLVIFFGTEKPGEEQIALLKDYFAAHPETVLVYGDEDEQGPDGSRLNPWLKPDWSPDTLISYFYFGNIFAVRREAVSDICWLGDEDWRKNLYDFCLKVTDDAWGEAAPGRARSGYSAVGHVDSVLVHSQGPIVPFGMEKEFDEVRWQAYVRRGWPTEPSGKVSILILSKDHPGVLSTCIHSILEASTYRNFEIIVLDNGSSEKNRERVERMLAQMQEEYRFRYVYAPQKFNFSKECNQAAALATGDYILLLNDDIEVTQEDWLEKLLLKAALPHVGAVGVKLLYPDSFTIQHAGITNIRLGPAHKLQFRDDRNEYYYLRNRLAFDALGVTGACLMVKRSIYESTGGLKEDLRVAFNDVDFCYRMHDLGLVNVVRCDVTLYHHESLSRGLDDSVEKLKRLHQELNLLYELHPSLYGKDPYYHRYLVKDVLDQEYHTAARYEYQERVERVVPTVMKDGLRPEWKNEVLRMGIEFAGDLGKWETGISGSGDYFIQGWCYALQVDNSQYRFRMLLKPLARQDDGPARGTDAVWSMPVSRQYRPDIQANLMHLQRVELPGVCLRFDREALPSGEYLIGFLWEDCCSRQRLYQWTAETITVGE